MHGGAKPPPHIKRHSRYEGAVTSKAATEQKEISRKFLVQFDQEKK
ncbi:MAG: hypothetical protein LC770_13020 [Acidobacteria bacterium]|nr:hypothetical protein [Acidobacteriota bacterium]